MIVLSNLTKNELNFGRNLTTSTVSINGIQIKIVLKWLQLLHTVKIFSLPESLEEGGVDGDNILGEHAHHRIVVLRLPLPSPTPKTLLREYLNQSLWIQID
jgi:hypothetical protein